MMAATVPAKLQAKDIRVDHLYRLVSGRVVMITGRVSYGIWYAERDDHRECVVLIRDIAEEFTGTGATDLHNSPVSGQAAANTSDRIDGQRPRRNGSESSVTSDDRPRNSYSPARDGKLLAAGKETD